MGSLAFAAGGALEGGGKGIADAASQNLKEMMEEKLMNLKEGYENQRQQAEFGQQTALAGRREEFERGMKEREFEVGRQSAEATRGFEKWKEEQNVDAKKYASDSSYAARVDSAYLRGAMSERAAANKPGSGDWVKAPVNIAAMKMNPETHQMEPDLTAPPSQKQGMANKRTGRVYAPQGEKYVPWDNEKYGPSPSKGTAKAPPTSAEIADLVKDPDGVIPPDPKNPNNPNVGLRKADVFEAVHGFLPAPYFNAVNRGQGGGSAASMSKTESLQMPSGRVFKGHVPAANVGPDPYGENSDTPTAQDSDNTPAQ